MNVYVCRGEFINTIYCERVSIKRCMYVIIFRIGVLVYLVCSGCTVCRRLPSRGFPNTAGSKPGGGVESLTCGRVRLITLVEVRLRERLRVVEVRERKAKYTQERESRNLREGRVKQELERGRY